MKTAARVVVAILAGVGIIAAGGSPALASSGPPATARTQAATAAAPDQAIAFGPTTMYDTGGPNAIAMNGLGQVVEVHVGTGRLFYRVGVLSGV